MAQLITKDEIHKVYCLVRSSNPLQRVFQSLSERHLEVSEANQDKIFAFSGDLGKPDLGLDAASLALMRREISLIIHIAWPVNFNIPLQSFEPQIAGLYNILQFSLSVKRPQPAQVFFGSSVSVAMNTPPPASIPDAPVESFDGVSPTGYARSKFVGERIVQHATRAGARSYVLRIGQIVGDTQNGVWTDREFLPMIIRSALTLKALPVLPEVRFLFHIISSSLRPATDILSQRCSWLPVDTLATVILELSDALAGLSRAHSDNSTDDSGVYNLVNPHIFSWEDLLSELHACGLEFTSKPFRDWLQLLRKSAAQEDEMRNPAIKLLEYFENNHKAEESLAGEGVTFVTTAAQRYSSALKSAPKVVETGPVRKFLTRWLYRWSRREP